MPVINFISDFYPALTNYRFHCGAACKFSASHSINIAKFSEKIATMEMVSSSNFIT